MRLKQKMLPTLISLTLSASMAKAQNTEQLSEITVTAEDSVSSDLLGGTLKPNEMSIGKQQLRQRASTLGNALNGELGVHSSQFGGGASSPIIRGQEGVRLKVLQNGLDVVDMSQLSPDHAVATDTLLANQVEIVRGANTLLYATASTAGVVNVMDNRIPTKMPEKRFSADVGSRFSTNNREFINNAALTLGLGNHWVIRAEGLQRRAGDYRVPQLQFNEQSVKRLPNSFNRSNVGTIGLSFVGDKGYIGAAYSQRRDIYGLVGHNHKFDSCEGHIVNPLNQHFINRYYLHSYPHLMDDSDVLEGAHFHCGSGHENSYEPSHQHPFGHHIAGGPFIDMRLKRYEVRGEWRKPLPMISKIQANMAVVDYYHDEREAGSEPVNLFNNNGKNIRLSFVHEPISGWKGVWGVQYQTQTSSAYVPRLTQPPKTLDYALSNFGKIIKEINGDSTPANLPFAEEQEKKHVSGAFKHIDAVQNTSSSAVKGNAADTENASTLNAQSSENSLGLTSGKNREHLTAFSNLLKEINSQPAKPSSDKLSKDEEEQDEEEQDKIRDQEEVTTLKLQSRSIDERSVASIGFSNRAAFGDLLKEINSEPSKPSASNEADEEDEEEELEEEMLEEEVASTPEPNRANTNLTASSPSIHRLNDFSALLNNINSQPEKERNDDEANEEESEEEANIETTRTSPSTVNKASIPSVVTINSLSNLINEINSQPEKPRNNNDVEDNEAENNVENVSNDSEKAVEDPEPSAPSKKALIDVEQLVKKIEEQPKPKATSSKPIEATWKDRLAQGNRYALVENRLKQVSLFGVEQLAWKDFLFEVGLRYERQSIHIDYDRQLLANERKVGISANHQDPDLSPYQHNALSYSGAVYWNFKPEYLLSLIVSHNERLPTPMELYYHGKHLATNSFEYGNKDLKKEVSNNVEINIDYQDDLWRYTLSSYYNQFKNHIFKRTINKEGNLLMNRYAQAKAVYYGIEGKIDYQLTPSVNVGIFGDYVRGILKDLPALRLKDQNKNTYEVPASKNAPRVPPARLGSTLTVQFTPNLTSTVRYAYAFTQRKTAALEQATRGYHQLDLGVNYKSRLKGLDYDLFLDANNLLNQPIYSHASFLPFVPQMGRNIIMGANLHF